MIINAKDKPLSQQNTCLPNVSTTLFNWFKEITFTLIRKNIIDFEDVEVETNSSFIGVVQPFNTQQLIIRTEGQRKWKWYMIHALPNLILKNDDVIIIDSIRYRVMERMDYKEEGYVQYNIVEDYVNDTAS